MREIDDERVDFMPAEHGRFPVNKIIVIDSPPAFANEEKNIFGVVIIIIIIIRLSKVYINRIVNAKKKKMYLITTEPFEI